MPPREGHARRATQRLRSADVGTVSERDGRSPLPRSWLRVRRRVLPSCRGCARVIAEVLERLKEDEAFALEQAYAVAHELARLRRAYRDRLEEREAYQATGIIPRRLRSLALKVLRAVGQ